MINTTVLLSFFMPHVVRVVVEGGFLPSLPLTAYLYVNPTMTNLWRLLVWWLLVWWLLVWKFPVWHLPVWHLPDKWVFSLAMPIDGFGFGGGWFHGFATACCSARVWRQQDLRSWVRQHRQLPVSSSIRYIVLMLLKPPVSPRPQNTMLPNPM